MKIHDALVGRENNLTLMRLLAAIGVLYFHCFALSLGASAENAYHPLFREMVLSIGRYAVDMFFVISGFLVTGSYVNRSNLILFIEARVLRVFPGLIVVNLFCVFVVGVLATSYALPQYFNSSETIGFIKQNTMLLGGIQLTLPGVFLNNPYPTHVNGSLWTLPIEIMMYLWVAVFGLCLVLQSVTIFNIFIFFIVLGYVYYSAGLSVALDPHYVRVAFLFILGGFFYINRRWMPLNFANLVVLSIAVYFFQSRAYLAVLEAFLFAYFVIVCAYHPRLQLPALDRVGDISYGVYVYAFPVQQLVAYYSPGIMPLHMLIISLPITCLLAMLSWRYIENPALQLKGRINYAWLRNKVG